MTTTSDRGPLALVGHAAVVPPHDLDAEAAVLSAIILDPKRLPRVAAVLRSEHFYADANRLIYEAILAVSQRDVQLDLVTIAARLKAQSHLQRIGGTRYLAQIADATPEVAHVETHAAMIVDACVRRQARELGQRLAAEAPLRHDTADWLSAASLELARLAGTGGNALSVGTVIRGWAADGPLVHEPTGIARLDELTGGGPVYGSRWYLPGAPDAGKTAFLMQLAQVYAMRGVAVGVLAVDEDASDIVTRLAQRAGYARIDCELRDSETVERIGAELGNLPIRIYDDRWTIEAAAADLAGWARESHGGRAMLGVDSLQTVTCDQERAVGLAGRELHEAAAVTARVRAIREVATTWRLIALVTSELGRGAYRSSDPAQQTSILASSKWSGTVEYSARVLLGMRSVPGEPDLIELELAKNKHGPRDVCVHVRIDRRNQTLSEVSYAPAPKPTAADRDSLARERTLRDAAVVARILRKRPDIGVRALRAAARAEGGMGHDRVEAGVEALGSAVVRGKGPRGAHRMTLVEEYVPENVRRIIEAAS